MDLYSVIAFILTNTPHLQHCLNLVQVLGNMIYEESLKKLRLFSLWKKSLRGQLIIDLKFQKSSYTKGCW